MYAQIKAPKGAGKKDTKPNARSKGKGQKGTRPKDTGKGQIDILDKLNREEKHTFRSGAGVMQYLAQDMRNIQYSVKKLSRTQDSPTKLCMRRLKRTARFVLLEASQ